MNEDIKVQVGEPKEKSVIYNPKMEMVLRKTLSGDYAIFDHADLDIVVQPEKKQILAFPKNEMSDDVYAAQDRLFDFLNRKGVLIIDSVQSGNVYGSMQAVYPEAKNGSNETQVVIYSIGRFIEEEKPYYAHEEALEDEMTAQITEPSREDSTELGEVPQEVQKGTVPKFPAIRSYYRVY
jgi:Ni,Fe-hydrogenase maturation factor